MNKQKSFFALATYVTFPSLSLYILYKAFAIIVDPMDKTTVVRVFILLIASFIFGWISCYMILKARIESQAKSPKINLPFYGPKIEPPEPTEHRTADYTYKGTTSKLILDKGQPDLKSAEETVGVSLMYLIRFASMPIPSRSHWRGSTVAYTRCKDFFLQAGLLYQDGQSYKWASGVISENVVKWLEEAYT